MDNLEDFIRNNKEGFDQEVPKSDLWDRIQAEQSAGESKEPEKGKRAVIPMQFMKMAASFLILALAAFGGYKLLSPATVGSGSGYESLVANEVAEMDQYYESQVRGQFAKVQSLIDDEKIIEEVKEELKLLDEEKSVLLTESGKQQNNKEVVEALMKTYRMKLQLLEQILTLLDDNDDESEQHI